MLSRRQFLGVAGGVAAGSAAAGALGWATLLREHVEAATAGVPVGNGAVGAATTTTTAAGAVDAAAASRVLVVLQLAGGNDGCNTLVPASGRYRDARPTLALPEASLVRVDATTALHPALAPLRDRWAAGQIAALAGIGLAKQSRSHFSATDAWAAGTDGVASTTGWLGRWLDATEAAVPNPLRAISLGTGAPALVGQRSLPTVVLDPAQFTLRTPRGVDARALADAFLACAAPAGPAPWSAAAQAAIPAALDAVRLVGDVRAATDTDPDVTAPEGSATSLLSTAAGIIEAGIGTRVLLVGVGGFDTHAGQLARHEELLGDVARGITAFFDRLTAHGLADRVLLVTTSEFGRRIAENGSGGTDHGFAGVQLVAGPAVRGGRVIGALDVDHPVDGDVPIAVDTRSLYAVALDWLGGPTDEVLGGHHDRYALL